MAAALQLDSEAQHPPALALSAGVGASDLPDAAPIWLRAHGVALEGLQRTSKRTPRAWQLFEEDGTRTQVWRTRYHDPALYGSMLRPSYESMPAALRHGHAFHIGVHPERFELDLLQQLKRGLGLEPAHDGGARAGTGSGVAVDFGEAPEASRSAPDDKGLVGPPRGMLPWLSVETFTTAEKQVTAERLAGLLAVADVFSPNELEAASMLATSDPYRVRRHPCVYEWAPRALARCKAMPARFVQA